MVFENLHIWQTFYPIDLDLHLLLLIFNLSLSTALFWLYHFDLILSLIYVHDSSDWLLNWINFDVFVDCGLIWVPSLTLHFYLKFVLMLLFRWTKKATGPSHPAQTKKLHQNHPLELLIFYTISMFRLSLGY